MNKYKSRFSKKCSPSPQTRSLKSLKDEGNENESESVKKRLRNGVKSKIKT
jgi:hypothetical protein